MTRCVTRYSVSSGPATRRCAGTSTTVPPTHSDMVKSQTATSNPMEANCATRLVASTPSRSTAVATRLPMPSWVSTAPFGLPVEPEV